VVTREISKFEIRISNYREFEFAFRVSSLGFLLMSQDDAPIENSKPPRRLLTILGVLLGLSGFLLGVVWINQWTRERIANLERYTIAFADIDCPPPPDQSQAEFLAQVQYLGAFPDRVQLLDESLPSRLQEAFQRHPAVEKVLEVKVVPPRQVQVRLIYRALDRASK